MATGGRRLQKTKKTFVPATQILCAVLFLAPGETVTTFRICGITGKYLPERAFSAECMREFEGDELFAMQCLGQHMLGAEIYKHRTRTGDLRGRLHEWNDCALKPLFVFQGTSPLSQPSSGCDATPRICPR